MAGYLLLLYRGCLDRRHEGPALSRPPAAGYRSKFGAALRAIARLQRPTTRSNLHAVP